MACRSRLLPATASLAICFVATLLASISTASAQIKREVVIWAWDTPNDLSFLAKRDTAFDSLGQTSVAAYAETIVLRGDQFMVKPYRKQLKLPSSVASFPVVRIETTGKPPQLSAAKSLAKAIAKMQKLHAGRTNKIQIDFDATISERAFYKSLLNSLRHELKPGTFLSVTALASWCLNDRWLTRADCDEAVAMLFSMGPGQKSTYALLQKSRGRLSAGDNLPTAIAISINEPKTNAHLKGLGIFNGLTKLYVFDSLPWLPQTFSKIKGQTVVSNI